MILYTRQWQHIIVGAPIFVVSLLGMNALQPFAAAAALETKAKMENGEGGGGVGPDLLEQLQGEGEDGRVVNSKFGLKDFVMGYFKGLEDDGLEGEWEVGGKVAVDDTVVVGGSGFEVKDGIGARVGESWSSSLRSSLRSSSFSRVGSKSGKSRKRSDGSKDDTPNRTPNRRSSDSSSSSSGGRSSRNYREARIIGGSEAIEDYYSFTVALQDSVGFFCGGSLIAKDVVLTAAHCQGAPFDIVIGRHDLREKDGQVISIKKQLPHPDYNPKTTDNDFMLVFLNSAATVDVDLIKLNDDSSVPDNGDHVTVIGWGDTDIRDDVSTLSDVLRKVQVKVISNKECGESSDNFDTYRGQISENMVCAKANLQDSCQGDSGGPLVLRRGGSEVQVGVVSWGIGCASQDFPGVYARLSRGYQWIKNEVCEGEYRSNYASEAGFNCANAKVDPNDSAPATSQSDAGKPSRKPSRKPRKKPSKKPSRKPNKPSTPSSAFKPSSDGSSSNGGNDNDGHPWNHGSTEWDDDCKSC